MQNTAVLVPVKAFSHAKARLASVLDEPSRAALARQMAENVLAAAHGLSVTIACDHEEVAAWAKKAGVEVAWTVGLGLNGAVQAGVDMLAASGAERVIVAHADLPHARDLTIASGEGTAVVAVPDRRDDGTNVLSVPTNAGFRFAYGPRSFGRHRTEAERLGLSFTVLRPPDLTWDVDIPADLDQP